MAIRRPLDRNAEADTDRKLEAAFAEGTGKVLAALGTSMATASDPQRVPQHVADTVETLAKLHASAEKGVSKPQRSVEALTFHLGRPFVAWAIAGSALAWMAANAILPAVGLRAPDPPPFAAMQTACSLGALIMAAMVLAAQNRQRRTAEEHAQLDLHVNLLAEQKVTKLIALLEELRRDMPDVANREDPVAKEMTQAVDAKAVASALKETIEVELATRDSAASTA